MGHPLDPVLRPHSVAVVGASTDPRKRGYQAVRALVEAGFAGRVHPVNPRGGEILGLAVSTSLEEIPSPVDLALVCTPAGTVPDVIAACGRAGVPGAVLLAVGFAESGPEGAALERAVAEAARSHGVRLVGPNTSGILNLPIGLNLIGARGVRAGGLGLVVQSGNLALNLMLDVTRRSADGISVAVGVGNELDLGFADVVDFLASDPATRAVLVHAEGLRNGPAFLRAAAAARDRKPVVLLKAARTAASADAARSHTAAVTGGHEAFRVALRHAGVVEVERSDELLAVGLTLAGQPAAPAGTGIAVLSDGGGQGTLTVDLFATRGVPLAALADDTRRDLRQLLGPASAIGNPVDLAGAADSDPTRFADALDRLVEDPAVGAVLVVGLFGGYARRFDAALEPAEVEAAERMVAAARASGRGLVIHTMYAPDDTAPLAVLRDAGVPVVDSLEVAGRCAEALVERGRHLAAPSWAPVEEAAPSGAPAGENDGTIASYGTATPVAPGTPVAVSEVEARRAFEAAELPLVPARFAEDASEAVDAALAFGGPVSLKVVADGIVHKSDAGGVLLGRSGADAVRADFETLRARARAAGGRFRGVLVSPMVDDAVAEILLGAHRDPVVGPVVSVGAGGRWVEIAHDVATRALPLLDGMARTMIDELRITPVLRGARGRPAADVDALARAIEGFARWFAAHPEVAEAEINPLLALPEGRGVVGVDARVLRHRGG
jgi:acetyltransferase